MERDKLSREYQAQAGANRGLLASGNVDIASGSAADSLLGNAMLYSEDLAANRYNRVLAGWQANENARQARWQGDTASAQSQAYSQQASWLNQSAGGIGDSLLSAGIAGASTFASGYLKGGGFGGTGGTTSTSASTLGATFRQGAGALQYTQYGY
jgi:hypothetical protein